MKHFVILGNTPSLKNQKQIFINKRIGKPFITSSNASKAWTEAALWQLKGQTPVASYPVTVAMTFYFQGKHRKDLDNCVTSVLDVLVTAGILEDDNFNFIDNLQVSYGGQDKENPRVEVWVEES